MQKPFFAAISLALLFFVTACSSERKTHKTSEKLPGAWQVTPVVADGKSNDWPTPYPFENNKAMISYAITNDKDNLYISVKTGDQATELKLLRKGLVVWIDKTGDKNQTTSICFPSDNENSRARQGGQSAQGKEMMAQHIDEAIGSVNEFFIQGFKGCRGKFTLVQGDSCGIKVGIGLDEYDQLVWEAVIPFKTFYTKNEIDRRDLGRPIAICFDIQGMERPAGQENNNGMHMGGMGVGVGMGGMSFGRGMGGNRYNSNPANEQLYKSISFWKKIGIAYQAPAPKGS